MSVVLVTMDASYSLGNTITMEESEHQEKLYESTENSSLNFSVVNILRPDFGRAAILSKCELKRSHLAKVNSSSNQSPTSISEDFSPTASSCTSLLSSPTSLDSTFSIINGAQRQPRDSLSSHCDIPSPIHRHYSSLSRSGSLESLASSRSSIAGGSNNYSSSISSSSSSSSSSVLITGFENPSNENSSSNKLSSQNSNNGQSLWPAWIYCTRYSDRPSSGPRTRRIKRVNNDKSSRISEEKRPRTAFSAEQLARLRYEFSENRYLTEPRRQKLSKELGLHEQQIKIWFQNKRAKIKKASGQKNPLALQLMAQGLYNHSTVPVDEDGEELTADHE